MSIYWDNSTKSDKRRAKRHNCWRLDICVAGKRIRKRSHNKGLLENMQESLRGTKEESCRN